MMKTYRLLCTVMVCGLLIFGFSDAQAQTLGTPDGSTAFFNTNSTGRLLGHRELGTFGNFASSNQWIGIGQPTVST